MIADEEGESKRGREPLLPGPCSLPPEATQHPGPLGRHLQTSRANSLEIGCPKCGAGTVKARRATGPPLAIACLTVLLPVPQCRHCPGSGPWPFPVHSASSSLCVSDHLACCPFSGTALLDVRWPPGPEALQSLPAARSTRAQPLRAKPPKARGT